MLPVPFVVRYLIVSLLIALHVVLCTAGLPLIAATTVPLTKEQRIQATLDRWRWHPEAFVREEFGIEPDKWQLKVLRGFPHNNRLAMKACKGPGKTAVLAWLVLNFLATRPHPRIACTSITGANLSTALWPEIAKWLRRSPYCRATFIWSSTAVKHRVHGATWWAQARTWSKSANAEEQSNTLAGLHEDYALFVLDESGGIPDAVMVTALAVLSSGIETKVVQAGNPTHTTGPLYRACNQEAHLWHVTTITGDPDDPERSPRISVQYAREQIELYGRDNPWVMVNILGLFPPSSINALLGHEEVMAAMKRWGSMTPDVYGHMQKRIGVDVARFGDDRSVIFPRQGMKAFNPFVMRNWRTNQIAARVALGRKNWGAELIIVDDTGHWGHGVVDNLITAGIPVIPVIYSDPAINPRYRNRRTEMWMELAEWVKAGGALPNIPELIAELTEPTYTFIGGAFALEEKAQIKARIGKSPDLGDALAQTFAIADQPSGLMEAVTGGDRGKTRQDEDPFPSEYPQDIVGAFADVEFGVGRATQDGDPYQ